ncbi:MAG: YdiU family protein [Saprospiraceae bacterium]
MLKLENTFTSSLPGDPNQDIWPRQVENAMYSFVLPQKFPLAKLRILNDVLTEELGLSTVKIDILEQTLTGNQIPLSSQPYAMVYGGHQFGQWAGQLGDGRAINLGEIYVNGHPYTLQLKGAGPTPYSRAADGYAVLRSSIREFLISEAMYYLRIPTTRALSLATTGASVLRDIMYNGNAAYEPGAIVCRTAPTFIRFGNFEIFSRRNDITNLKLLADYTIHQHFKHLEGNVNKYLAFFREVARLTCDLMVEWQRVGFVHGVMNTDNMSIIGLTIDYGPFGWMDNYDPYFTPNTTDLPGKRYQYANQPYIAQWNLMCLGRALLPLIHDDQAIVSVLNSYRAQFEEKYLTMMSSKLGLDHQKVSMNFIEELLKTLEENVLDMTIFYCQLAELTHETTPDDISTLFLSAKYKSDDLSASFFGWIKAYQSLLPQDKASILEKKRIMARSNPRYVLRNYMLQLAIESAQNDDFSLVNTLFELIKNPYDKNKEAEMWFSIRPEWAAQKIGSSMLSCSS